MTQKSDALKGSLLTINWSGFEPTRKFSYIVRLCSEFKCKGESILNKVTDCLVGFPS